jgi:hypothetical protein
VQLSEFNDIDNYDVTSSHNKTPINLKNKFLHLPLAGAWGHTPTLNRSGHSQGIFASLCPKGLAEIIQFYWLLMLPAYGFVQRYACGQMVGGHGQHKQLLDVLQSAPHYLTNPHDRLAQKLPMIRDAQRHAMRAFVCSAQD